MQPSLAAHPDISPPAPHRCPRCLRHDTIPMPGDTPLDRLAGCFRYVPFRCRACRAKFYRRRLPAPKGFQTPVESAPTPNVVVSHWNPEITLQRVERIIRIAESRRLRRG